MLKRKKIIFFALVIIIALILFLIFIALKYQKLPGPTSLEIEYKVVREGSIIHPFAKRKVYDVVVGKINEEKIEIVAEKLIEEITKKDNDIDQIHLIFFSDEELIETQPFDIAQAIWGPKGEITPEIAENNLRDNYEIRVRMKEQPYTPSQRAEVFDISGAKMTPDFVDELIIDPFYEAEIGESQYFSVWVEDLKGVALVKVIIKDLETEVGIINLVLKEGDNTRGRWEGTWTINNVTLGTAPVLIFQAQNQEGETAEIETYFYVKKAKQSWLKDFFSIKPVFAGPCFPLGNTSGNKTIPESPAPSCSISSGSTVGTDGGNLIIQGDITMESNSTILFESGHSIEIVSGKILKSQTNTKIQKGDVVVTPSCTDDCSPSGTQACCDSWGNKTCGNYDADSCLEWSACSSCGSDYCVTTITWRDYYCTGSGTCTYSDYYCSSNCYWCGDGRCDSECGENPSNCSTDCGTIACYNDSDCNDGDYCTYDYCYNDGTTSSYCSNPAADRCGDGTCNCGETSSGCPADCGAPNPANAIPDCAEWNVYVGDPIGGNRTAQRGDLLVRADGGYVWCSACNNRDYALVCKVKSNCLTVTCNGYATQTWNDSYATVECMGGASECLYCIVDKSNMSNPIIVNSLHSCPFSTGATGDIFVKNEYCNWTDYKCTITGTRDCNAWAGDTCGDFNEHGLFTYTGYARFSHLDSSGMPNWREKGNTCVRK